MPQTCLTDECVRPDHVPDATVPPTPANDACNTAGTGNHCAGAYWNVDTGDPCTDRLYINLSNDCGGAVWIPFPLNDVNDSSVGSLEVDSVVVDPLVVPEDVGNAIVQQTSGGLVITNNSPCYDLDVKITIESSSFSIDIDPAMVGDVQIANLWEFSSDGGATWASIPSAAQNDGVARFRAGDQFEVWRPTKVFTVTIPAGDPPLDFRARVLVYYRNPQNGWFEFGAGTTMDLDGFSLHYIAVANN